MRLVSAMAMLLTMRASLLPRPEERAAQAFAACVNGLFARISKDEASHGTEI
ncbi:MAG: hypothetical protein GHHEDOFH_03234 [Pseudorhodoplanes sp.]|nr:hypothetical protein [Pseudorhodoplanes sp.]